MARFLTDKEIAYIHAAELARKPIAMSEALGNQQGKTLKLLQYDRMRTDPFDDTQRGGPWFSWLQKVQPEYQNVGAAFTKKSGAKAKAKESGEDVVWAPFLGAREQHKSNLPMFNKFMDEFDEQLAMGNISPELLAIINKRIATMPKLPGKKTQPFDPNREYDISDPKFRELVDTYDRRGAIAEMLRGKGVGGPTKGRTVKVEDLLAKYLEPSAADVDNWSIGDRLVQLDKNVSYRPDLHKAYPYVNHGEDLGVKYKHAPAEIVLRDFNQNIRDKLKREPMQIDWRTMSPSQFIDDDFLKYLQQRGYKKGGGVSRESKIAEYKDPPTTKAEDWKWRALNEVHKDLGKIKEVPDYVQGGYGDFMKEQLKRAEAGDLNARDLIKAYTITQSSIGRGGLSHATATKRGLKLPNTGGEVRPEGAFAEWLGSPMGQRYLNLAEQGKLDPAAMKELQTVFAPFGKQDDQVAKMQWAADNLPGMAKDINTRVTGGRDDWRDYSDQLRGIAAAKSGFIGSLLGRGDIPTLDARQLKLQAPPSPVDIGSIQKRGKGTGGRELVDRLASRQSALDLSLDPSLAPFYQHLGHHAIWDKMGNTETTHKDLVKAMRGYKTGGMVEEAISDTVKNPNAVKMLNLDLAKLALMKQQPKRMAKGGKAEVREIGIDPNRKKVTDRNPDLERAAQLVAEGKMTREEYWRLADKLKPVRPYDFVPKPASTERVTGALKEPQRERYGTGSIPEGRKVGLRLDIPAYSNHGVWVNSVHDEEDKGKAYYEPVSHITDAVFDRFENKALKVAAGTAKAPFARITGNWRPIDQDVAVERAQEYLAHPEWRQVGMDPTRRGHFYDRESMQPIHSADEVIQIGPLVLAKKPVYGKQEDYSYAKGGKVK